MASGTTPGAAGNRPTGRAEALAGTGTLIRFILRRDRVRMPVWIAATALPAVATAVSYPDLYPTAADRQAQAEVVTSSPAMAAMTGPGYGADNYTYGAMIGNEMLGFVAVLVALMSVLLLVRHTRAEEEMGRAELVRAHPVGRYAPLTAALTTVACANVMLGALIAVGYGSLGVESMTWTGSFAFGAALAAVGLVFTGIAAVTTQLTEYARAASGWAGATIGIAYALRAAGDMGNGALSWLSPIGWAQQTRPYVDERWWPLALALAVSAVLVAAAYMLSTRRDLGAGMTQQRGGSASASDALAAPLGFAVRLQRGSLIGWAMAMTLFGLAYGAAVGVVEDYADNEFIQEVLQGVGGTTMIEQWLSMIMSLLAMICTIYAIQAALRLRSEEIAGRAEPVLATALSRTRWVGTHLVVAFVGGAGILLLSGLALGVSAAASQGDAGLAWSVLRASAAYIPALWLTAGLAVAVFGLFPRAIGLAWAILVYAIVVGYLGALLQFPQWMFNLTPFGHVPRLPGAEFTAVPLVVLTAIAAVLIAAGLIGFRKRDLATT